MNSRGGFCLERGSASIDNFYGSSGSYVRLVLLKLKKLKEEESLQFGPTGSADSL